MKDQRGVRLLLQKESEAVVVKVLDVSERPKGCMVLILDGFRLTEAWMRGEYSQDKIVTGIQNCDVRNNQNIDFQTYRYKSQYVIR